MRALLAGADPDDAALVRSALFLSGLMAPAVNEDLIAVDGKVLEAAIIDAGARLLAPGG
mgnify:CR=1 FL=1